MYVLHTHVITVSHRVLSKFNTVFGRQQVLQESYSSCIATKVLPAGVMQHRIFKFLYVVTFEMINIVITVRFFHAFFSVIMCMNEA